MSEIKDFSWCDYERFSHGQLADMVAHELVACGISQESQPASGRGADSFRLMSWVESPDSKLGHALAISQPYPVHNEFIRSNFYCVDREERRLVHPPKLMAVSLDIPASEADYEQQRDDKMGAFDKQELIIIRHMLGKAASSFNGDDWPLDHDIRHTLIEDRLDDLAARMPKDNDQRSELVEHILEWSEFVATAKYSFRKHTQQTREPSQEIALEYEHESQLYAANLKGHFGNLSGVEILWLQDGVWQGRSYNLDPETDEDDLAANRADPSWDRDALVATVREGMPIPGHLFSYYMSETLR